MQEQLKELAEKYISNLEAVLNDLKTANVESHILEHIRNYLADAKYYYSHQDYITAIVCASYAEGVTDGVLLSRGLTPKWVNQNKKVLVVGTWDLIHLGHIKFLWFAKKHGRLYVIVAKDVNVTKAKGRPPIIPEEQRAEVIKNLKPVDYVIIGDENDFLKPVEEIKPDIIILGPDEQYPPEKLQEDLKRRGLTTEIIKLTQRFSDSPLSSSSAIIRRILKIYEKQ